MNEEGHNENGGKKYWYFLCAAFAGGFIGTLICPHLNNLLFTLIGVLIGLIFSWFYSLCTRKPISGSVYSIEEKFTDIEQLNESMKIMERILTLRTCAAERLRQNEFWIRTLNIYYSCFTALLALCSLREKAEFLVLPSACFTITVAILVTYANAQKYGDRANDLRANCIDLELSVQECRNLNQIAVKKRDKTKSTLGENEENELKRIMSDFIKKQGDSESHTISDAWKCSRDAEDKIKYSVYLGIKAGMIFILFLIPVLYVGMNYGNFTKLM